MALAENFGTLQTTLKPTLQVSFALLYASKNHLACPDVIAASLMNPDPAKVASFCGDSWSSENVRTLISFCARPTTSNFKANQQSYFGFSFLQMNLLCDKTDDTDDSMGFILNEAELSMAAKYKCPDNYCSSYVLSHFQLVNSSVSLNPPQGSSFPASTSIKDWFPSQFPRQFELRYFLDKTNNSGKIKAITLAESLQTFSWDNLLSPLPPCKALASYYAGDASFVTTRLSFSDPAVFERFINFQAFSVYLGGHTYTATVCQVIFGFTPDIIAKIRSTPPLFGGDPSTPQFISLNENNTYLYQTRYTGKNNLSQVGQFYSANGQQYINALKEFWDGAHVKNQSSNPWAEKVPLAGGDGGAFVPHSNKKQKLPQVAYVTDILRAPTSSFSEIKKKSRGLSTYRYLADSSMGDVNEETKKFYQFKYAQMFNLSVARRAPVLVSKLMMKDTNQTLKDKIQFFDQNMKPMENNPEVFEGWLDVEPRTGAPVDLNVNFLVNVDMSKDALLDTTPDLVVPVFQIRRTMVLSDSQVIVDKIDRSNFWEDDTRTECEDLHDMDIRESRAHIFTLPHLFGNQEQASSIKES